MTENPHASVHVEPGTIALYSDLACPWAHVAVFRLLRSRNAAGLDGEVRIDHRPFLLEEVNRQPTPRRVLEAEIPVLAAAEPGAGWQVWPRSPYEWPVTTLPAAEAVQAAKQQGLHVSEKLDRALRVAFFRDGCCLSLRHEILDVAARVDVLDEQPLAAALDAGSARRALMRSFGTGRDVAKGSPHLFLVDGAEFANPGIEMRWSGEHGRGFPRIVSDDPSIYDDVVRRAALSPALS
jgi:predicted DsbA family dithiol-disulfide isomerase